MTDSYDTIYLAPHLDDAVLSCGGQIFLQTQAGKKVLVLTIMAGDPPLGATSAFAQSLHARWQLAGNVVAGRRAEDAEACAALGAAYEHWDIPDCIYRVDPLERTGYYESEGAIFGAVAGAEDELVGELSQRLRGLPEYGRLVGPLTVGNHVDHQIVQRAAAALPQERIAYYEDYPYAAVPGAIQSALIKGQAHWRAQVIPLTQEALQAKIEAISAYSSQVGTFFRDEDDLVKMVRDFATATGGERIWWRIQPGGILPANASSLD